MAEDKDGTYWDGSSMTRAVSKIAGIPALRSSTTASQTRRSTRSVNTQPASDKENRNNSDGEHGKPQKSHHSRRVESEDEDDSHREEDDYQPEQADSDNDNDSEAADADKDSEAESDRESEEWRGRVQAEAEKNAKAEKAAKAAKKKAGVVVEDARPPIDDDHFAARTVPTTQQLAQRNTRVSPPAQLREDDRPSRREEHVSIHPSRGRSVSPRRRSSPIRSRQRTPSPRHRTPSPSPHHRRTAIPRQRASSPQHHHTRSRTRSPRRAPSPRRGSSPPVRHTFRGRSPAHESPARRPVLRDINNNVVTNPIAVNLRSDHHRARSSSPHRSSSPGSAAVHRLSTQTMTCVPLLSHGPAAQVADPVPRISMMTARNMSPLPATKYYRCLLARRQAFPDSRMETEMISSRGSQMRGEIKIKSRPLIDPMYGFESGQNKETVETLHLNISI
ncbi:hypothetical protein R3P38DRAFT_3377620 [Favolaschia claudopus]|uniref:DUF6532 domain-containing protein n=1 Tax=Favolaschia claudopus TaxID=2862362 RepID=A0AAV9ZBA7_9AGAR